MTDQWQAEVNKHFNPDDLSEWLNMAPEQIISMMCFDLSSPIHMLNGYIELLLTQPIADEIAFAPEDVESTSLREVLERMHKNAYLIDRAFKTLRAYKDAR